MRRFFSAIFLSLVITAFGVTNVSAQQTSVSPNLEELSHAKVKKKETSMYADFFDKNVYDRGVQWFYIPRVFRKMFNLKKPSVNANVYDELPDSTFFTNRIGRKDMTAEEIVKGPEVTTGPETTGPWTIVKGKFEGITPGFFIKDAKGNEYLLKFDPPGYAELSSGAEAIASRMMYALGYNVPQYTVVYFDPSILTVWEHATYYAKSGFNRPLTMEKVTEALKDINRTPDGKLRASASLKVGGILKGPMSFNSFRKEDPNDYFRHRNHREIKALIVFASWLNNHDLRKGNTLDTWIDDGKGGGYLKHYLIDFGSSFGSAGDRPKDPTFTFEYFLDYKDVAYQTATLGVFEPDWKKRWETNHKTFRFPSAGNFDNLYFRPENWKPEIPHYAFDDMTLGDAFWAAKIIMKLKPEALKEIMAVGQYSDKDVEKYIYDILTERQKMIGQYWFGRVTPLDEFELKSLGGGKAEFSFKDLEVFYNLSNAAPSYRYRVVTHNKKGKEKVYQGDTNFSGSPLELDLVSFKSLGKFDVVIEKLNSNTGKWNPPVILTVSSDTSGDGFVLAGIWHADKVKK
ncbi:MAG: hypothetical protein HZC17_07230 [Candidatus Omnitrophica bacterium]|nr:hypothetical protein [Candidatus Omnitrophota bacterium]